MMLGSLVSSVLLFHHPLVVEFIHILENHHNTSWVHVLASKKGFKIRERQALSVQRPYVEAVHINSTHIPLTKILKLNFNFSGFSIKN